MGAFAVPAPCAGATATTAPTAPFLTMGYTHYFRRATTPNPAAFNALKQDAARLFAVCAAEGIALGDAFGESAPELGADRIAFNGAAPSGYESMIWNATEAQWDPCAKPGARVFCFCKTGQRPYDDAVVAFLLLAQSLYGDQVQLSSDGTEGELASGLALLRTAFPDRCYTLAPFMGAPVA